MNGDIGLWEFCDKYNDFYDHYALDGHESNEEERLAFEKHQGRIEPHGIIACEILGHVCSDEDAKPDRYTNAGRFCSAEAVSRLKQVVFLGK